MLVFDMYIVLNVFTSQWLIFVDNRYVYIFLYDVLFFKHPCTVHTSLNNDDVKFKQLK